MPEVMMPRLSDSMEEGTIVRWLKADGEEVRSGEEIVEIETDKATMTYEAEFDGMLKTLVAVDEVVPLGAPIAFIGEEPGQSRVSPPAAPSTPASVPPRMPAALFSPPVAVGERAIASPLARRVALDLGIELAGVVGSGVGGRIVKADVMAAAGNRSAKVGRAAAAVGNGRPVVPRSTTGPGPETAKGTVTVLEPTRLQQTVARRMAETKATVPEFNLTVDVDMERVIALRDELKQGLAEGAAAPSYNDFVVKASALALRSHPRANGAYRDGRFEIYGRVNVGIAVAAEGGLVVPVIEDADQQPLGSIAAEARALAEKVRDGRVTPPELAGGTFTVSNLGMYGVGQFTAVINSPQAAILAVGAMSPRAVVVDGEVAIRRVVSLTLTCDHRILYGAQAAEFLAEIRSNLEQPLRMAM
jgi:pyruvate dehydrogenase E2 component (dihydrolipoamide acetyltransferase)